jgi:hypothetical protein
MDPKPGRLMRLAGPIAYLHRDTTEPMPRRLEALSVRDRPLVLTRGVWPVVSVTDVTFDGDTVRAEARMETPDPIGTRYPVAIQLGAAIVDYLDPETGAELPPDVIMVSDRPVLGVFRSAELIGVDIVPRHGVLEGSAWPDAYLEVIGPWAAT